MVKKRLHILLFFVLAFAGFLCSANAHSGKQKKNVPHKDAYEHALLGAKFKGLEKIQSENKIDDSLQQVSFGCLKLRQACDFVPDNLIFSFEFTSAEQAVSNRNESFRPDFIEQKSLLYCYPFLAFW